MRVISRKSIRDFSKANPAARSALDAWHSAARQAVWRNFPMVKQTFGQTDQARVQSGNQVAIFDIGGNKFRLIARISYEKGKVYILRIMDHKEYDKRRWVEQL